MQKLKLSLFVLTSLISLNSCTTYTYNYEHYDSDHPKAIMHSQSEFNGAGSPEEEKNLSVKIDFTKKLENINNIDIKPTGNEYLTNVIFALPTNKYNYPKTDLYLPFSLKSHNQSQMSFNLKDNSNSENKIVKAIKENININDNNAALEHTKNLEDAKEYLELLNNNPEYYKYYKNKEFGKHRLNNNNHKINSDGKITHKIGDRFGKITTSNAISDYTCVDVSTNLYIFLEDKYLKEFNDPSKPLSSNIKELVTVYNDNHDKFTEIYGSSQDIDNNGKTIIIITSKLGSNTLGMFNTRDIFPKKIVPLSNEGEFLYLNAGMLLGNPNSYFDHNIPQISNGLPRNIDMYLSTIFHEMSHLVIMVNKIINNTNYLDSWLNEAMALQAEILMNQVGTHKMRVENALENTDYHSLTTLEGSISYGHAYLFIKYITERLNTDEKKKQFVKNIINTPYTNVKAIEEATGLEFNQLYTDYLQAILLSGRKNVVDPRVNLQNFENEVISGYKLSDLVNKHLLTTPIESGTTHYNSLRPYSFLVIRNDKAVTQTEFDISQNPKNIHGFYLNTDNKTSVTPALK